MRRKFNTEANKRAKKRYEEKNELVRFYAPIGFKEKALKKADVKGFTGKGKFKNYIIDLVEKD